MKSVRALIIIVAGVLCLAWTILTWPGSQSGGEFYAYPVTASLLGFWAIGWAVVLIPTMLILRKIRKR